MIAQFIDRKVSEAWLDDNCRFCKILQGIAPAYVVYETDEIIAFLDTLPIRPGHTLVIPKVHFARLTDLPVDLSRALGEAVTRVGEAITKGLENERLNVVCNQGFAQAVHHVHFHIVPAPLLGAANTPLPLKRIPSGESIFLKERENRDDLDDEEAKIILEKIRSKL